MSTLLFDLISTSKVYMMCPALAYTGGPDAMHQLVDMMRRCGLNAFMHYLPSIPDPTRLEYAQYDAPYARRIEDRPENLMIVPEVMTSVLRKYDTIQKAVWWLSADNHLKLNEEKRFNWQTDAGRVQVHFAQSAYARHFLKNHGVSKPVMLIEYLHERYMTIRPGEKRDQVAYFAKKNAGVIERLIKSAPDIHWVPIKSAQEMSPQEVQKILNTSKVYVDFGPHPGRDRMPREAAMQGACILIGNRGAAAHEEDYPLPDNYKWHQAGSTSAYALCDMPSIIRQIRTCFENYEQAVKDFDDYRAWIRLHKEMQRRQVIEFFGGDANRDHGRKFVRLSNVGVFYGNKILKKLSGYSYKDEEV